MKSLSVIVSVWNEERKIARLLSSVSWANEIIVVDNSSTDATVSIAKKFTSKIFVRPNHPMLNLNKNYGFTKATSDWVLSLDGDEEIPPALASEIQQVIAQKSDIVGYWLPRKNIIFGKWIRHGLWWPDKQLRLFRRDRGEFPCKHVHEYLEADGPTGQLQEPYIHYNYETVSQFIRKMESLYTESEVEKLLSTNYQLTWTDAIRFPTSDFVKVYFAQEGYKDGLHGLILALLQGFYAFIVFAKFWERQSFPERDITLNTASREMYRAAKEIEYWRLSALIKHTPSRFKQFWFKLRRRYVAKI